jgi:uncharacterized protein YqhQ
MQNREVNQKMANSELGDEGMGDEKQKQGVGMMPNADSASTSDFAPDPDFAMGGQAVLEGVMMKGPVSYAVAVRRAEGNIEMISHRFVPIIKRHSWLRLPIVRGAVSLVEMLIVGYRALDFSANVVEQSAKEKDEGGRTKDEAKQAGAMSARLAI